MNTHKTKDKLIHLEILRIIAILFVIYDHAGPNGGSMYQFTSSHVTYYIALLSHVLCKTGVPIFFMISGALLLAKDESILDTYKKRIPHIFAVLLIFSIIRYVYLCVFQSESFSVISFLHQFAVGSLFQPYWYLYTYMALLLIMPFLRRMVCNMTDMEVRAFMIILIALDIMLPLINIWLGINNEYIPYAFIVSSTYMITGYLIEHRFLLIFNTISCKALCVISLPMLIYFNCLIIDTDVSWYPNPTQSTQIGITLSIFYISKWISHAKVEKIFINPVIYKLINTLGACTFGIYLIEDYVRNITLPVYDFLASLITKYPASLVWAILVFTASSIIVFLLRLLPAFRKLL